MEVDDENQIVKEIEMTLQEHEGTPNNTEDELLGSNFQYPTARGDYWKIPAEGKKVRNRFISDETRQKALEPIKDKGPKRT